MSATHEGHPPWRISRAAVHLQGMTNTSFNDEHPRDRDGRFTDKPDAGAALESDIDLDEDEDFELELPDALEDAEVIADAIVLRWGNDESIAADADKFESYADTGTYEEFLHQVELASDWVNAWTEELRLPRFGFQPTADGVGDLDGGQVQVRARGTGGDFMLASGRSAGDWVGDRFVSGRECARSITTELVGAYKHLLDQADEFGFDLHRAY